MKIKYSTWRKKTQNNRTEKNHMKALKSALLFARVGLFSVMFSTTVTCKMGFPEAPFEN